MTTRKSDELLSLVEHFARSQRRQQVAIALVLSAMIAIATVTYTWTTWKSMIAIREASEIQRQLLELQKLSATAKVALTPRRSDAHPRIRQTSEAHRVPSRELRVEQESVSSRQTLNDSQSTPASTANSTTSSHSWNTRSAMLDRPGRQ